LFVLLGGVEPVVCPVLFGCPLLVVCALPLESPLSPMLGVSDVIPPDAMSAAKRNSFFLGLVQVKMIRLTMEIDRV